PDGSRGAIDEYAPARKQTGLSEACQGEARSIADRRCLFERHAGRLMCQRGALPYADELRVCAEARDATDVVTDRELGGICADGRNLASELHAEDPVLGSAKTGDEAGNDIFGAA